MTYLSVGRKLIVSNTKLFQSSLSISKIIEALEKYKEELKSKKTNWSEKDLQLLSGAFVQPCRRHFPGKAVAVSQLTLRGTYAVICCHRLCSPAFVSLHCAVFSHFLHIFHKISDASLLFFPTTIHINGLYFLASLRTALPVPIRGLTRTKLPYPVEWISHISNYLWAFYCS